MNAKIYAVRVSFRMFVKQIAGDAMLAVVFAAPFLAGSVFRFLVPFLAERFAFTPRIAPFYQLFDVFLCILTPYMCCFASAMIMLGELDDHVTSAFFVSPLGRDGYLVSRLFIPTLIGAAGTVLIFSLFHLTPASLGTRVTLALLTACSACISALLTVAFARNRVEGMALAKLSGIMMLGALVPYVLNGRASLYFAFLPPLWISRFMQSGHASDALACLAVSAVWMSVLYRSFMRRWR
ncbi:hypothetical protein [Treponema brennaborense]|uniref:ABC-2 type transporter n=1 Tax=Treponema brennaborense (strain DSM 12168 / CIP 105900 / DD5/3) TaxID=906968 RepID=F4LIL0_TREBD|nr:hypothetical protein [Treponema brennaborense]AEE17235.1 hypothetical protein Trebr_1815 [Treponema brennaborense DSM 12168]